VHCWVQEIDFYVACKVEKLPFENDFFDYIIGYAVLHHTFVKESLQEIWRVLKKGGVYIGMGELALPKFLKFLRKAERRKDIMPINVYHYSLTEWRKFFIHAGFKEVNFTLERSPKYKNIIIGL
jgi:ubiquinone/menaquinone biosynthesis C-methylase UbiE